MQARLLVFARAPVSGEVKTRLHPALGADGAAGLYAELLAHALEQAAASAPARLELWYAGDDREGDLADLAARHGARLRPQPAGDLGERMRAALADATADGTPAMILGTDCPGLGAGSLRAAADALASHDAVLGPATDGGYVLLGLHRAPAALFAGIDWGTERVLPATRTRLEALGWRWSELPERTDVDRPEDLHALASLGSHWARWSREALTGSRGAGGITRRAARDRGRHAWRNRGRRRRA